MAALLVLWEIISRLAQVPGYILPAPSAILQALGASTHLIIRHTRTTMLAVAGGLTLAVAVAVLAAAVMDRWLFVKRALYPLIVISQAIPIFALAPLMLIWFGVDLTPKIIIVALVCFFPLAVSLTTALEQVNTEELELLKTMQGSNWQIIKHVKLPFTLPYFFSGLRIAATYSVLGAIIGEWLGARAGLGIYMLRAKNSFQVTDLFASIVVVVALSLALFKAVEAAGLAAMPWLREKENLRED